MPKIPVQIGELRFDSKGEAEEHFRQMLYRHPVGSRIPAPDATELSWLLERNPESQRQDWYWRRLLQRSQRHLRQKML